MNAKNDTETGMAGASRARKLQAVPKYPPSQEFEFFRIL
jgi:hypothetical protein